jgi:flavorubredoxin
LAALQQRLDLTNLDYVILGHANSNRGETLKALLDLAPQLSFVCSNPAAIALRAIFSDRDLKITVMRGEEALDLGQG